VFFPANVGKEEIGGITIVLVVDVVGRKYVRFAIV
jgi:hypothetical protein